MKKKILSSLSIGAFVFGLGAADVQTACAASFDNAKEAKDKYDKAKDKYDKAKDKFDNAKDKFDGKTPPEPPKDSDGNYMPPPDGDNSNRPEPPKFSN